MFLKFLKYAQEDAAGGPPAETPPPTPPAPPAVDIAGEIRKGFESFGAGLKALAPQAPPPPKESYEWDDPAKFWLLPEGLSAEEQGRLLHEKQTKYNQHLIKQALKDPATRAEILGELPQKFQNYDAAFAYFDTAKANDPEFVKSKDAIKKIMDDEGISYKAAKRIYDAETKTAAPAAPPTAPKVPTPGKHATAPQSSVEPKPGKSTRGHGLPKVKEIIRNGLASGKIKFD